MLFDCKSVHKLQHLSLSIFLSNHSKWNEFITQLTVATDLQLKFGMGIKVTVMEAKNLNAQQNSMMMLVSEAKPNFGSEEIVDHSTRFAKSLGFYEDTPWSLSSSPPNVREIEDAMNAEELLSQDKRQFLEDSGRLSYLGEED